MNLTEMANAIVELQGDVYQMTGALQKLGADRCDTTKEWHLEKDLIKAGDRCQSLAAFDPDYFYNESDEESEGVERLTWIFRQIQSRGLRQLLARFPRDESGVFIEPYLSAYKKATHANG